MNKLKQRNLIGKKFGKLTVIEMCGNNGKGTHYKSKVKCECGKIYKVNDTELINGRRTGCRSCNSYLKKHGKTNTKLFNVWQSMKQRCYYKSNKEYKNYGGRGIKMCEEWKNDFMQFYNWSINSGYKKGLTIDRIDVNGNYEPNNCRWATQLEQANNKRNNILITYKGITDTLPNWARKTGIQRSCLEYRYSHNWDIERMLTLKSKIGRNQYDKS